MKHVKNIRTFLRPVRGFPVEAQREACAKVIKRLGLPHVEYVAGEQSRDLWVKALRPDEVALLPRLDVLAEFKTEVKRPGADFAWALPEVVVKCAYLVDATAGITSKDGERWRKLVEWASARITTGRRELPRKKARAMARSRWAKAEPGVVALWLSPAMVAQRKRWGSHWRDPMYPNAQAAFDAFPEELQQQFGSVMTARRIFKHRRPGDPSAGGRPPKTKRGKRK